MNNRRRKATIARITKAYVRRYRDNGQVKVYVEWVDTNGESGRTEGNISGEPEFEGDSPPMRLGTHMRALLARAKREGVPLKKEVW